MEVFKNYQSLLHKQFQNAQSRGDDIYTQSRIRGGNRFLLKIRAGKIQSMHRTHDLSVNLCMGRKKKNVWRVFRENGADLSILNDVEKLPALHESRAQNESDPRPSHFSSYVPESGTGTLPNYDSQIDGGDPTLVFHRTFQSLAQILKKRILVDADISYQTGAYSWDYRPLTVGFIDNRNDYFHPQTWVDEQFTFYSRTGNYPRMTLHHGSHTLSKISDFGGLVEPLAESPVMLKFNRNNVDDVVLSPEVVAGCLRPILKRLCTVPGQIPELASRKGLIFSPELVLRCDAGAFGYEGMMDDRGHPTEKISLIADGQMRDYPSPSNGHILDQEGNAGVFFPVLSDRSSEEIEIGTVPFQEMAQSQGKKVLFLEPPRILYEDGREPVVYFFAGGSLYSEGNYLGYVVGPNRSFPLFELFRQATPVGKAQRLGNMAVCGLKFGMDFFGGN